MSSKKGAFVYQQIELTSAEWATNTTLYPASTWLFERLESGKFNMKLADGVHTFAELPAVMQDISVAVKTNNATTYILTITTAAGSFDTPNLRGVNGTNGVGASVEVVTNTAAEYVLKFTSASGEVTTPNLKPQNYTHPSFTAHASGLYKITVNDQGHITNVATVSKADITGLGIPEQDTIYSVVTTSANGLMSKEDKQKLDALLLDIPIVSSAPNIYTTTYTDKDGVSHPFKIGQMCRVSVPVPTVRAPSWSPDDYDFYIMTQGWWDDGEDHAPDSYGYAYWRKVTRDVATQSEPGLMSAEDKSNLDNAIVPKNVTVATTLTGLSIANYSIKVTLSAASALSFASTPYEGWESMIDIKNNGSSDITQALPNATGWQCDETSMTIAAGKIASISVRYVHGTYVVLTKGN